MILTCEKTHSTFALDAGKENSRLAKIRTLDNSLSSALLIKIQTKIQTEAAAFSYSANEELHGTGKEKVQSSTNTFF